MERPPLVHLPMMAANWFYSARNRVFRQMCSTKRRAHLGHSSSASGEEALVDAQHRRAKKCHSSFTRQVPNSFVTVQEANNGRKENWAMLSCMDRIWQGGDKAEKGEEMNIVCNF